jgi:hypothetical protein
MEPSPLEPLQLFLFPPLTVTLVRLVLGLWLAACSTLTSSILAADAAGGASIRREGETSRMMGVDARGGGAYSLMKVSETWRVGRVA